MTVISRPRIGLLCVIATTAFALFATAGSALAAGTIEGEVVDAGTEVGIEGAEVCALEFVAEFESCEETDAAGDYAIGDLPNGEYIVVFLAVDQGYATQLYDGASKFADADEVPIDDDTVSGVNAKMEKAGKIEGRVTDAAIGAGIGGVEVCAFSASALGGCAFTDLAGNYSLGGLATASYEVEFWAGFLGYETLFFDQKTDPDNANLVSVTAPATTAGIDARLSKPGSTVTRPDIPSVPAISIPKLFKPKPGPKATKCRKGFKKVKRHGRRVCVKKHKKKKHHRS